MRSERLKMVRRVTREHGERFAGECAKLTRHDVTTDDVFAETAIFTWPNAPELQERYRELRREIVTKALAAALSQPRINRRDELVRIVLIAGRNNRDRVQS